ncbi:MAG: Pr6Pr family membrane protein [Anaerolineales bacterium]
MDKRRFLIAYRLIFGLLTLSAIGVQFNISMGVGFSPVSFFSYFTNLSNVIVSLILIIAAFALIQRRQPTEREDLIRGAGVVYITVVGLVYVVLLRGEDLGALLPWINTQLHIVMPIVVIADWLYQPPKSKLSLRSALVWLIFPLLYLVYSLVRGALIDWYPYPFLNPGVVGGYGAVALYCMAILAAFFVISWAWITLGNRLKRRV